MRRLSRRQRLIRVLNVVLCSLILIQTSPLAAMPYLGTGSASPVAASNISPSVLPPLLPTTKSGASADAPMLSAASNAANASPPASSGQMLQSSTDSSASSASTTNSEPAGPGTISPGFSGSGTGGSGANQNVASTVNDLRGVAPNGPGGYTGGNPGGNPIGGAGHSSSVSQLSNFGSRIDGLASISNMSSMSSVSGAPNLASLSSIPREAQSMMGVSTPDASGNDPSAPNAPNAPNTTDTPTNTSTPTIVTLRGHVLLQGRPTPPNARWIVPISFTLRLSIGGPSFSYNAFTDPSGYFTVTTGLAPGDYAYFAKNSQTLSIAGNTTLIGGSVNSIEMGTLREGDANNDNCVNIGDFTIMKNSFGKSIGQPGYDARADFTGDNAVTASDFNLIKGSFGQCGPALPNPGQLWQRVAGSGIDYKAISMVNATEGWAVGSDRGISHWNGTDWADYPSQYLVDFSLGRAFYGVSALDATHAWAVGEAGMNYYWDGASWSRGFMTGTANLMGVSMVSPTEAWAVDDAGQIWKWTGTGVGSSPGLSWTRYNSPAVTGALHAISMVSPADGWAVGVSSGVYHFDGVAWTKIPTSGNLPNPTTTLNTVHALSSTDIWVAGDGGAIWHSTDGGNNANFSAENGCIGIINGINMLGTDEGWAVGNGNLVCHRSPGPGGLWQSSDTLNAGDSLQNWNAVATISNMEGWVVGAPPAGGNPNTQYARMLRRTGSNNTWDPFRGTQRDNGIAGIDALVGSHVYGGGEQGAFSVYSGTVPNELGSYILQKGGATFNGANFTGFDMVDANTGWGTTNATTGGHMITGWTSSIDPQEPNGKWISATYTSGLTPTVGFNGIHMLNSSGGWAVGDSGNIYTKSGSGTAWAKQITTTTNNLRAVWAVNSSTIYAVGNNSIILRSTDGGSTWPGLGSVPNTNTTLNSVHCTSGGFSCWVVGDGGTVWSYDSGTNAWNQVAPSKVSTNLYDVWVVASGDVWAVGQSGAIIHFDGSRWSKLAPSTSQDLRVVQMISATEGYSAGDRGVLLHLTTPANPAPVAAPVTVGCRSGSDSFGYSMTGSACAGGPSFNWIPGTNVVRQFGNGSAASFDDGTVTADTSFSYNLYSTKTHPTHSMEGTLLCSGGESGISTSLSLCLST